MLRIMLAALCLLLTGCGQHYRVDPILLDKDRHTNRTGADQKTTWWETRGGFLKEQIRYEVLNPYKFNPEGKSESLYVRASVPLGDPAGEANAKQARNRLQSAIVRLSDQATS